MSTLTVTAPEITCSHCVGAITGAVRPLSVVESVDVDVDTKKVTVRYAAPATEDTVRSAIVESGYDLESYQP